MPQHALPDQCATRRDFLRASAATAALALSTPVFAADSAPPPLRLACRLASYGKFEQAAWKHLPDIGIRYLFLNVPAPEGREAVQEQLQQSGLTPLVMRGAADLSEPESVAQLSAQLATCQEMGVRYMFLSPKHGDAPKETAYARLREAGEAARAHEVTITLETHPDLGTNGRIHLETMRAIDHPNIRVNFDTGNITYYHEGADAVEELRQIAGYVATVELKDHNGALETWVFPPLGQGIVDFKGTLSVLDAHGYTGPVTLEFEGVEGVTLDEAGTLQAIEESVNYLRSLRNWS